MHYTFMKPKSSYAFGFGFGTVLPVFQWHCMICAKYYLRYSTESTWKPNDFLWQDWSGIEQGWIYGEWETGPWWGFRTKEKEAGKYGSVGLNFGLGWLQMQCNFIKCEATFLECETTLLKCKATLLKCNATLFKCEVTLLKCDATLLESSGGLDWAREWGQTTWSGDTPALS